MQQASDPIHPGLESQALPLWSPPSAAAISRLLLLSACWGFSAAASELLSYKVRVMAVPGRSMLYSLLLFIIILSLLEMYRGVFASSELLTIAGGFVSSLLFVVVLTFVGNYQESCGDRTGWGAVLLAETVALVAASTVHRVCITTCFLFSAGFLYEINKLSGMMQTKVETKAKRY